MKYNISIFSDTNKNAVFLSVYNEGSKTSKLQCVFLLFANIHSLLVSTKDLQQNYTNFDVSRKIKECNFITSMQLRWGRNILVVNMQLIVFMS